MNKLQMLAIVFCVLLGELLLAQSDSKGLVINEIFLNAKERNNSWVVIFNQNEKELTLKTMRYLHVKTINMLPDSIQEIGGLTIPANSSLIVMGSGSKWKGENQKSIVLPVIEKFSTGGMLAITYEDEYKGIDAIRYGDASKTEKIKELKDKPVIKISNNNEVYLREFLNGKEVITLK